MITLYDKFGTTKLGELSNCIECLVEEERNGLFELRLTYPSADAICSYFDKEKIIISNASDTLLNQKFRIYDIKKTMGNKVIVYANHISYDLAYDIVKGLKLGTQSCEYSLNQIFKNSVNSKHYVGYSDIVNSQKFEIDMRNPLNAIVGKEGSIIDTYGNGAELLRDNEKIHILKARGKDNGVSIEYSVNMTDIEVEENTTDTYNVILPYAKYSPKLEKVDTSGDISNLRFYRNKSDYNTASDGEMFIGGIDSTGKVIAKGSTVPIKVYGKTYNFKTRALNPCTDTYKVILKETLYIVSQTTSLNVYAVWIDNKAPTGWKAIRIDEGNKDATSPWNWTWVDSHFILGEFSMSKLEFVNSGHINKTPKDSYSRENSDNEETQEKQEDITVVGDLVYSERDCSFLAFDRIIPVDFSSSFNEEIPTNEKLKALAKQYFIESEIDIPNINYKVEFIPLSKTTEGGKDDVIGLCDKVIVKDKRYNINIKTKVIRTIFNVLKNRYESIELNTSKNNLSNVINSTNDKINNLEQSVKDKINEVLLTPNTLPPVPNLSVESGFSAIRLSWTYEKENYYEYELYASMIENFEPNVFDLIFKGQSSSFTHNVEPSQTWYYKVRCVNKRGYSTEFSNEGIGETFKLDDASTFFENAAIGSALIGSLNADVINAGTVKGQYIDAKNLSVTDGNGKRTFYVDSFGNVNIDGCTTAGNTTGKYITIDQGNYSIFNEDRNSGFFGFKTFEGYTVPRLLMGMYGITKGTHNYGGLSVYPGTNNPEGNTSSYIDLSYHCAEKDDYSNLKMYSTGDIRLSPIKNLEITTNFSNGTHAGTGERLLGKFTTSGLNEFNGNLQVNAIANHSSGKGLILCDRFYDSPWDGEGKGGTWRTSLQILTASTGVKYVRPYTDNDVVLGSTSNRWKSIYSASGTYSSDGVYLNEVSRNKDINISTDNVLDNISIYEPTQVVLDKSLDCNLILDVTNIKDTIYVDIGEEGTPYMNTNELLKLALMEIKKLKEEIKLMKEGV